MHDDRPEWNNQPIFCSVCRADRDDEGKCKCPPPPSLMELMEQMTQMTNDVGDD
jgi:hypothetical protein